MTQDLPVPRSETGHEPPAGVSSSANAVGPEAGRQYGCDAYALTPSANQQCHHRASMSPARRPGSHQRRATGANQKLQARHRLPARNLLSNVLRGGQSRQRFLQRHRLMMLSANQLAQHVGGRGGHTRTHRNRCTVDGPSRLATH